MIEDSAITKQFAEAFGASPTLIARAPGRVNLIGEHTDYNGGFVLPAAIANEIKMAARVTGAGVTGAGVMRLHSANFGECHEFAAAGPFVNPASGTGWQSYFLAVADQFARRGAALPCMDVAIDGDVPLGSGLSSSAAYEVCAAVLLDHVCGTVMPRRDLALLAQTAEHSPFVGVRCGIMDQFISALGEARHALMLDCHTLDYETVPFDPAGASIVIINSMKKRGLVDSEYNRRRHECEEGLRLMRAMDGTDYPTIRHIPWEAFERGEAGLPPDCARRLRHNLSENRRVREFANALRAGNWRRAGKLLYESHTSLRDDFEVSCAELDMIVEIARGCDGVFGCRMTGAGFGGCAVALVAPAQAAEFSNRMRGEYLQRAGVVPVIITSEPADGAGVRMLAKEAGE